MTQTKAENSEFELFELAKRYGVHPRTLVQYSKRGQLKITKVGGRRYVAAREWRRFMEGGAMRE